MLGTPTATPPNGVGKGPSMLAIDKERPRKFGQGVIIVLAIKVIGKNVRIVTLER